MSYTEPAQRVIMALRHDLEGAQQIIAGLTHERDTLQLKYDRCFLAYEARLRERDQARAEATELQRLLDAKRMRE